MPNEPLKADSFELLVIDKYLKQHFRVDMGHEGVTWDTSGVDLGQGKTRHTNEQKNSYRNIYITREVIYYQLYIKNE